MVLLILAYVIELIASFFFHVGPAQLRPLIMSSGQDFQPMSVITHFFIVGQPGFSGFMHLLFELLILWSFGSELDRLWGSRNFYSFFFLSQLIGAGFTILAGSVIGRPFIAYGISGGLSAMMMAYAVLWPNRQALFMFVLPLRMKWIVLILFLFLLLGSLDNLITNLASTFVGLAILYRKARAGRLFHESSLHGAYSTRSSSQSSPLVRGESPADQGLFGKISASIEAKKKEKRLAKKQKEIERRIEMQQEVDRLLEKISVEGMQSLSRKEKTFLDQASKEL